MPFGFSDKVWFYLPQEIKQEEIAKIQQNKPDYWKINHDTWEIYRYGDTFKAVYIKFGGEAPDHKIEKSHKTDSEKTVTEERFSQSLSRTRARIYELAICNEFTHFCTFTQDKEKVGSRFDLPTFRRDFAQFIRNLNRGRDDKIKYLVIPEHHKDGAWHMHGLLQGLTDKDLQPFTLSEKLPQSIRVHLLNGEAVYNWEQYARKFGYFTATEIKSHEACSKYITKYITKDLLAASMESGAHSFFASQGLNGRRLLVRTDKDKCPFEKWDFENDYCKVSWFSSVEELRKSLSDLSDFDNEFTFLGK